jgi:hypothetical protein
LVAILGLAEVVKELLDNLRRLLRLFVGEDGITAQIGLVLLVSASLSGNRVPNVKFQKSFHHPLFHRQVLREPLMHELLGRIPITVRGS